MRLVEGTEDCYVLNNFFENDHNSIADLLEKEIDFASVFGKPKSVFQASSPSLSSHNTPDTDSFYFLRCPSIVAEKITNFTPTVAKIAKQLEFHFPEQPCNIAKVVKYGDGGSMQLKSHSDKIIDLSPNSNIFTVRFGRTKTMLLTHKETKKEISVVLPHNSMLVIGWKTNKDFRHGVPTYGEGSDKYPTYSVVLRTSVTKLHRPSLTLYGDRIGKNNSPIADKTLLALWSTENHECIPDTHYDEYCKKE